MPLTEISSPDVSKQGPQHQRRSSHPSLQSRKVGISVRRFRMRGGEGLLGGGGTCGTRSPPHRASSVRGTLLTQWRLGGALPVVVNAAPGLAGSESRDCPSQNVLGAKALGTRRRGTLPVGRGSTPRGGQGSIAVIVGTVRDSGQGAGWAAQVGGMGLRWGATRRVMQAMTTAEYIFSASTNEQGKLQPGGSTKTA